MAGLQGLAKVVLPMLRVNHRAFARPRCVKLAFLLVCFLSASFFTGSARAQPEVELELWTWAMHPYFTSYLDDLVGEFERSNPGVKVHQVDVPGDAITRKYFAAGAAGKLPDVVNLPDTVFLRFAQLGGLMPLDHLLPGDPNAVYVKPALDQCRVNGKLFGLPWYLSTEIAVVNESLLAQGGLNSASLPRHWDQLLKLAKSFHERTGKYLFILRLGDVDLLNMITAEGLSPIKPGAGVYQSNLLDPQIQNLITRWVQAYRDGLVPRESATAGYAEDVSAFKDQRVAVLNADAVRSIRSDSPTLYQMLNVLPGITGQIDKTNIATVEIAVSSQSAHPALAAKLAWLMTSPRWQERLCEAASRVPGTTQSLSLPEFSMPMDTSDKLKVALGIGCQQLRDSRAQSFIPPTGQWPEMTTIFGDQIKRSLLENVPVAVSLKRIDARWNQLLAGDSETLQHQN
jgi:putative chitobiose transport system substrate-binding protein